eukprot:scaffold42535_cov19-Tisochrysis_lutea.AAC.1
MLALGPSLSPARDQSSRRSLPRWGFFFGLAEVDPDRSIDRRPKLNRSTEIIFSSSGRDGRRNLKELEGLKTKRQL